MNRIFLLHPQDLVAVALVDLTDGEVLPIGGTVRGSVPRGHKVALNDISSGRPVLKYGQTIGHATRAILTGEHDGEGTHEQVATGSIRKSSVLPAAGSRSRKPWA